MLALAISLVAYPIYLKFLDGKVDVFSLILSASEEPSDARTPKLDPLETSKASESLMTTTETNPLSNEELPETPENNKKTNAIEIFKPFLTEKLGNYEPHSVLSKIGPGD